MQNIIELAENLLTFTQARSVFLYGSRARDDFYPESDYEIGVLIPREKYIGRSAIRDKFNIKDVNIFPFIYEEFMAQNPDTPFVKSIYLREIILAGKTLAGEEIIKKLMPPQISTTDILQELRFNLGYALAATHSYRNNDVDTASLHMAKSCLFATRDLIVLMTGELPLTYDEIVEKAKTINLGKFESLPQYANQLRRREVGLDEQKLFANISYLNQFVENQIIRTLKTDGDITLVK